MLHLQGHLATLSPHLGLLLLSVSAGKNFPCPPKTQLGQNFMLIFPKFSSPQHLSFIFSLLNRCFLSTFFFFFNGVMTDFFLYMGNWMTREKKKTQTMHNLQFSNKKQQLLLPATGNSYSTLLSTSSSPQLDKSQSTSLLHFFIDEVCHFMGCGTIESN